MYVPLLLMRSSKIGPLLITLACLAGGNRLYAQDDTLYLLPVVTLDSVVISDVAAGFDVGSFISLIQQDTTYYQAFRNLRNTGYRFESSVKMFDDDGLSEATYQSTGMQYCFGACRTIDYLNELYTGNFFDRRGEPAYYTSRMFASIFLYTDTICESGGDETGKNKGGDRLEKRKEQLKTLMFKPGEPVRGIPFVQDELGIFDEDMLPYYDYAIHSEMVNNKPAYVFTITKKPDVKDRKVVLQEMSTWFNRSDFSIMRRTYHLQEDNFVFDFNVRMDVRMGYAGDYLIPVDIYYNGNWNAPGKKRERGTVLLSVTPEVSTVPAN